MKLRLALAVTFLLGSAVWLLGAWHPVTITIPIAPIEFSPINPSVDEIVEWATFSVDASTVGAACSMGSLALVAAQSLGKSRRGDER